MAILRSVSSLPHATVDTLVEAVRADIGTISRQAAYDALTAMVNKGLLRRIQPGNSAARFEDRVDDNHHHLICRTCRAVVDVDCAVGEMPCLTAFDDHGYLIDETEVTYWGVCPTCQKHQPANATTPIEGAS